MAGRPHPQGWLAAQWLMQYESLNRLARPAKWLGWTLLVAALLLLARSLPLELLIARMDAWIVRLGVWGPIAYLLVYVALSMLLLPVWPLAFVAASLYGIWYGTLAVSLAATVTAAIEFLIARYVARQRVAAYFAEHPYFAAVDEAISGSGWRIVALMRLSPVLPFGLQNYLYGLTAIRFWPYVVASWVAMLPIDFLYVYAAYVGQAGLSELHSSQPWTHVSLWIGRIVGLMATVAVTAYVTWLARRAIRRRMVFEEVVKQRHQDKASVREQDATFPWSAVLLLAVAFGLLALGIFSHLQRDQLQLWIAKW